MYDTCNAECMHNFLEYMSIVLSSNVYSDQKNGAEF